MLRGNAIMRHAPTIFWVRSEVFYKILDFDDIKQLGLYIKQLKRGGTGRCVGSKDWVSNQGMYARQIDVKLDDDNPIHLHQKTFGRLDSSISITQPCEQVTETKGRS